MENKAPANINVTQRAYEILERQELVDIYRTKQKIYHTAVAVALAKNIPGLKHSEKTPHNLADTAAIFNNPDFRLDSLLKLFGYNDNDYVIEGMALAEAGLRYLDEYLSLQKDIFKLLIDQD